jgi:hypothetical protein
MGSEYFEWPDFVEWARVQKSDEAVRGFNK